MCSSHTKWLWLSALVFAASCGEAPQYRYGQNISGLTFELFDPAEGIHPSKVTLQNPRNPFRLAIPSDDTKYDILDNGGNAGAFYAWAALLATIPIGENQYYTARKLRDILEAGEVPREQERVVREMAINGFQAILDCFPESVFYDVTGTFPRGRLATEAFINILDLGGVPQGDWTLVTDSRGDPQAVRSTGFGDAAREILCF